MNSDRNRFEERDLLPITLLLPLPSSLDHTPASAASTLPPFVMGKYVDRVLRLSGTAKRDYKGLYHSEIIVYKEFSFQPGLSDVPPS